MTATRALHTNLPARLLGLAAIAFFAALPVAAAAPAPPDPSLVAWYTFDEGPGQGTPVKDWSGHGNDGKNIMGASYVALPSGTGFALSFDTPDAYVDCGNSPSLDLTDAFTIELWLYPETSPTKGQAGLVGKSFESYLLSYGSETCLFYVTTGPEGRASRTDGRAKANIRAWRHIVATFDGESVKTFSDGKLRSSAQSKSPKVNTVKNNLYLRYPVVWGDKVEPPFKCMMDEVRIYNRALSEEEVIRHYEEEIKERPEVSWFEAVQLDYRVLAPTSTLVVEADFSRMDLRPAGAVLKLELREAGRADVVARHEEADLPQSGTADCLMSVEGLPSGEYELRAEIMHNGARIGVPSSAKVKLSLEKPAWVVAYDNARILNNFVAELLAVPAPQAEAQTAYEFTNPRDGWILISSTVKTQGTDKVFVSVDSSAAEDAAIVHTQEGKETLDAMRHIPAGPHKLHVRCEGAARPTALIVRAIPEIIPAEVGYHRAPLIQPAYGPYTWEFLEGIGVLDNGNVILEREAKPENAGHLADWRRRGKKVLAYYNTSWLQRKYDPVTTEAVVEEWSGAPSRGFQSPDYDGIAIDEWASAITPAQYSCFAEAIKKIAANPKFKDKVIYPYGGGRYNRERGKPAVKACMDAGYKLAEEMYIAEQPTEKAAREFLNERLKRNMLLYKEAFPDYDYARHLIMNLGFLSGAPLRSDIYPGVDYKVYLDMQMNLLANAPTFFGLYGFQWYHIGYVDEEILRWSAKLTRHYCIEGKTERLTDDPYLLPHIANADFDEGAGGWTVESAEEDSVSVRRAPGCGVLQGRYGGDGAGDAVLVTRRSAKAPNRISQEIRELTPGRAYSVTMFITDYGDYRGGKSVEQPHHSTVRIEDVEMLPEKSFRQVWGSGLGGYGYGPFDRENQLYITYRRDVFRAKSGAAKLTISDWADDATPGGPAGQELAFNFIQVEPFYED
ncbi:MAG: LamG domain-containing protein [Planctomycetota bacterium]